MHEGPADAHVQEVGGILESCVSVLHGAFSACDQHVAGIRGSQVFVCHLQTRQGMQGLIDQVAEDDDDHDKTNDNELRSLL